MGRKVAVGLVDSNGTVDMSLRVPSQVDSAESLFRCVCSAIDDLLSSQGLTIQKIKGIGIGLPGKVDVEMELLFFRITFLGKTFQSSPDLRKSMATFQLKSTMMLR